MRVTHLRVQDFKRIRLVDVAVDGNVITIGGKNAQGKSSVLDAIWNALAGKQKTVERPIRDGESKASIEVTLTAADGGGYVVTRSFTAKGSSIKVTPLDNPGATLTKPQAILNDLIGRFAFDPLDFAMQDARGQLKTLLDLVDLDFDLADLEAERKAKYEERTFVGREVKAAKGALDTMGPKPEVDGEPVSVTALAEELRNAEDAERHYQDVRRGWGASKDRIKELEQQLAEERDRLANWEVMGREALEMTKVTRSIDEIRADMEAAEERNFAHAELDKWEAAAGQYRAKERAYKDLTEQIADLDTQKTEGLARANFPIDGLSFDEEGVLYQGVPFVQASQAEKIRVSVAMAMAMNPELKVICVKDASLLDEDNLALLRSLAEENDYQLFLEVVGSSDDWSFVLEDGEVAP